MIHLLFLGDVVGHSGCEYLKRHLPELRRQYEVDVCVVNGENSADGNGILPRSAQMLFAAGADVITGGNHTLRRREICDVLEQREGVLRPLNLHFLSPRGRILHSGQTALSGLCHLPSGPGLYGAGGQPLRRHG